MKFLKSTISFISSLSLSLSFSLSFLYFIFLPFKYNLTLFLFFLLNLTKSQFVSFSDNFARPPLVKLVVKLLFSSIFIYISLSLFFSLNFNSSNLNSVLLVYTVFIYSEGKTLINIKMHKLSSNVNNFLLSFGEFLFCMVIELSDSPLKKK